MEVRLDKLLKQTKKFLLYKTIPRAGFNLATGRFLPAGRMFDTPALWDHKPMDEPITTHDILV